MKRLAILILWPSFLVAIIFEGVFFSLFDPAELHWDGQTIELSARTAHTLGFFCFWLLGSLTSSLTCFLMQPPTGKAPV
jgi:hypothetical protein